MLNGTDPQSNCVENNRRRPLLADGRATGATAVASDAQDVSEVEVAIHWWAKHSSAESRSWDLGTSNLETRSRAAGDCLT
eukprot:CAMPEP_0183594704 /NCGR_PEP_ID=MMETSP0371-20130417/172128_1 /TAXON_ID=268820 /ORGANISM="Peridinium aciculiferum, Strain PAER-2" /LENGTH=79 /DNA_ID=CAMNT_0025806443 /DNA_START=9 /DNA_END=244 /DNA_ORIENTATION=+